MRASSIAAGMARTAVAVAAAISLSVGMLGLILWPVALAQTVSYVPIVALENPIADSGGNKLANGTITFTPGDNSGNPLSAMGVLARPTTCLVSNGAITTQQGGGTCKVADALLSNPQLCYAVTIYDKLLRQAVPTPGQRCAQPTSSGSAWNGSAWDYGAFVPNETPATLVQTGPSGPAGPACSIGGGSCVMTVPIILPSDPSTALQASTKEYVDAVGAVANAALPANGCTTTAGGNLNCSVNGTINPTLVVYGGLAPVAAATTANTTSTVNTITVASATGIVNGQWIVASGVPTGTTVTSVSGTTITMSAAATATATGVAVAFTVNPATNATALNAAATASYNTSNASPTGHAQPIKLPPGYYYMAPGVDAKDVPIDCAGYRSTSGGLNYPVTLDFSLYPSGIDFTDLGQFIGCTVISSSIQGGAQSATISSISEGAGPINTSAGGWVTVTLSAMPSNPEIQGGGLRIEGSTNYSGPWRAACVQGSGSPCPTLAANQIAFQRSQLSHAATESGYSGTVTTSVSGSTYTATWVSGSTFPASWPYGFPFTINGVVYGVKAVTSSTTVTLLTSAGTQTGVSYSAPAGMIYYHPTVCLQHFPDYNSYASATDVEWNDLILEGCGVAMDVSASPLHGGSTDNWHISRVLVNQRVPGITYVSQIALQAQGNGSWNDSSTNHSNVSLGHVDRVTLGYTMTGINCGPPQTPEEGGCQTNDFEHIDMEQYDTNIADGTVIRGIIIGGSKNTVARGVIGGFGSTGQTTPGQIDSSKGNGGNSIYHNDVSGTLNSAGLLINALPSDFVSTNGGGAAWNNDLTPAEPLSGDLAIQSGGQTQAPTSVTCFGNCSGPSLCYAMVCNTSASTIPNASNYGHLAPSAFTCTVNAAGGAVGPTSYGGSSPVSGVTIRVPDDNRCKNYDLLIGDTSHWLQLGVTPTNPSNGGSNYLSDIVGVGTAGYTKTSDTSGNLLVQGAIPVDANQVIALTPDPAVPQDGSMMANGHAWVPLATANLPTFTQSVLATTPAGYWPLSESSGNFNDLSGHTLTATVTNAPTYSQTGLVTDDSKTSILGSTTALATVASSSQLPGGGTYSADTMSFGLLFRRSSTQGTYQYFMCQKSGGICMYFNLANQLEVSIAGGLTVLENSLTITDTNTHCAIFTKNGSARQLYIDGVAVGSQGTNQTLAPADGTLYFFSNSGTQGFVGNEGNYAIWTYALTQAQVQNFCNRAEATKNGTVYYATDMTPWSAGASGGGGAPALVVNGSWLPIDLGPVNINTVIGTTNSTITTLSALSLPYSQITGAPASDPPMLYGYCTGTASSSLTLGLANLGAAGTTCGNGVSKYTAPITPRSGTASNLQVACATGGINSSSGVFTVMYATSGGSLTSTGLTCTVGTGTSCTDSTHTYSYAQGVMLAVQFTTQASETLANCRASFSY